MSGRGRWAGVIALVACSVMWPSLAVAQDRLPADFVFLTDRAPGIVEDLRYGTPDNFTGAVVPGYGPGARCVLRARAARALAEVAADLKARGYGLKVFDCYRPKQAVAAFVDWVDRAPNATSSYHPTLPRRRLIPGGYISAASGHSRGTVVDLTLIRLGTPSATPAPSSQRRLAPCSNTPSNGTDLDLGTDFDCLSPRANVGAPGIGREAQSNRRLLIEAMARRGFRSYPREWWHFSHSSGDGDDPAYDFPVPSSLSASARDVPAPTPARPRRR